MLCQHVYAFYKNSLLLRVHMNYFSFFTIVFSGNNFNSIGEAKDNAKVLESAVKDMETITGQKAIVTRAKNSPL